MHSSAVHWPKANASTEVRMWSRRKGNVAGWVGKFVSFAPTGVTEEDVRFQDVWLRTFQEAGADGKFHMRMIRRADQAAKSWPRAGAARSCSAVSCLACRDVAQCQHCSAH